MNNWAAHLLPGLPADTVARLDRLALLSLPPGHVLFRAGDAALGFVVILDGRVEVTLTAASGRDILLYAIERGQSCIQTTLALMGAAPYSGEGRTVTPCRVVVIPDPLFQDLINNSAEFRHFVFRAFADRMSELTGLLEKVAFDRIETRLARALCDLACGSEVQITHAELATRIGSAREVVSRQLEKWVLQGMIATERGRITLCDKPGLERVSVFEIHVCRFAVM